MVELVEEITVPAFALILNSNTDECDLILEWVQTGGFLIHGDHLGGGCRMF